MPPGGVSRTHVSGLLVCCTNCIGIAWPSSTQVTHDKPPIGAWMKRAWPGLPMQPFRFPKQVVGEGCKHGASQFRRPAYHVDSFSWGMPSCTPAPSCVHPEHNLQPLPLPLPLHALLWDAHNSCKLQWQIRRHDHAMPSMHASQHALLMKGTVRAAARQATMHPHQQSVAMPSVRVSSLGDGSSSVRSAVPHWGPLTPAQ